MPTAYYLEMWAAKEDVKLGLSYREKCLKKFWMYLINYKYQIHRCIVRRENVIVFYLLFFLAFVIKCGHWVRW